MCQRFEVGFFCLTLLAPLLTRHLVGLNLAAFLLLAQMTRT
jgi:hypothetical protein